MPAFPLGAAVKRPGESLAVPTWYYGQEPTTPFATKIGKYFQNSLREDGLITIAAHGIIFAQGKAGTLPASRLLEKLFTRNKRGPAYKKYVLVTSDEQEAVDFLVTNAPPANSHLRRLKSLGLLS
jgi:hypothetical protein